jgi:hypothetical protein
VKIIRLVLALLLISLAGIALSSCGYEAKGEKIQQAITEDVNAVSGVTEANVQVNANTSGTFITVKVTADSYDTSELTRILDEALTTILKDPRIEDGSFGMGVFSPDDAVSVGPSDLGYKGTSTLNSMRKFVD